SHTRLRQATGGGNHPRPYAGNHPSGVSTRRPGFWSDELTEEIRRSDAIQWACDSDLMRQLVEQANEIPRDKKGEALAEAGPRLYRDWAGVAWADLLKQLPAETGAEVRAIARADFAARLGNALTRIVTLAQHKRDEEPDRAALSLLHWCLRFAKCGPWAQIRSYFVWCRLAGESPDRHIDLRVAIRPPLLGQLGLRDLADLGQERLADLAENYGIGRRCRAGRGGQRAIELNPDWPFSLLEGPDGGRGTASRARAYEEK